VSDVARITVKLDRTTGHSLTMVFIVWMLAVLVSACGIGSISEMHQETERADDLIEMDLGSRPQTGFAGWNGTVHDTGWSLLYDRTAPDPRPADHRHASVRSGTAASRLRRRFSEHLPASRQWQVVNGGERHRRSHVGIRWPGSRYRQQLGVHPSAIDCNLHAAGDRELVAWLLRRAFAKPRREHRERTHGLAPPGAMSSSLVAAPYLLDPTPGG